MNKRHPHNDIIEKKLGQLPVVDADRLWNDMHSILDKKMPQKRERRRIIAWFLLSKPLLPFGIVLFIVVGSNLFLLLRKDGATTPLETLTDISKTDQNIEKGTAGIAKTTKENETTLTEPKHLASNEKSSTPVSDNTVVDTYRNNFSGLETKKPSEKSTTKVQLNREKDRFNQKKDQIKEEIQTAPKSRERFDIAIINLKENYSDLAATNHIGEMTSLNLPSTPVINNAKKHAANYDERGLYSGIISGVDLSSTNFKSVKTGSTKGFIIGYAFNNKWSLESGLLWDTKRVYDNGKNFNPPGYTPSSGITITDVNGKSRIYEIPVNIKYTIITGEHRLFATTGLSSYFMRSENYDYEYMQNNQPIGHNYLSYKNETKNWLSVANFSVGYTHKLGIGNLRVEPYLKLPIKKIGIGKMPIMSTGLNIGFTKTIK